MNEDRLTVIAKLVTGLFDVDYKLMQHKVNGSDVWLVATNTREHGLSGTYEDDSYVWGLTCNLSSNDWEKVAKATIDKVQANILKGIYGSEAHLEIYAPMLKKQHIATVNATHYVYSCKYYIENHPHDDTDVWYVVRKVEGNALTDFAWGIDHGMTSTCREDTYNRLISKLKEMYIYPNTLVIHTEDS